MAGGGTIDPDVQVYAHMHTHSARARAPTHTHAHTHVQTHVYISCQKKKLQLDLDAAFASEANVDSNPVTAVFFLCVDSGKVDNVCVYFCVQTVVKLIMLSFVFV